MAWVKRHAIAQLDGRVGVVTMDPDSDGDVKLRWTDNNENSSCIQVTRLEQASNEAQRRAVSWCKKDCAVKLLGRVGIVIMDPDSDVEVKVRWADDGKTSGYIKAARLDQASDGEQRQAVSWCHINGVIKMEGQVGVVTMNPDSDAEVKVKWTDGSQSGYLRAVKLISCGFALRDIVTYERRGGVVPCGTQGVIESVTRQGMVRTRFGSSTHDVRAEELCILTRYPVRPDLARHCDVRIESDRYAKQFDRFYLTSNHPRINQSRWRTAWEGKLPGRDGESYFCPSGWRRFSLKVSFDQEFFKRSSVMYHGTAGRNIGPIVRDGFIPRECQHGAKAVYLTPSIRYAAHPRYARIYKADGHYYQVALEVRVVNEMLTSFKGETMKVFDRYQIDPNFKDNNGMEFLFKSDEVVQTAGGIAVTGIMMRVSKQDPLLLPESGWWTCWRSKEYLHDHYYTGL